VLIWRHNGMYAVKVAGASHYRSELKVVAANSKGVPALCFCDATLQLDNANPYDANAISVWIQDHKVGHIPKDLAPAMRKALAVAGVAGPESHAAAAVSGGLETDDRQYEYIVELDITLPCSIDPEPPRVASRPRTIDPYPVPELQPDGSYAATVWLPVSSHDELHKSRTVMTWTTDDWPVVGFYALNRKQLGLGYKLTEVDKAKFKRMFGEQDVECALTDLQGRFARLTVRKHLPPSEA
jgi:hypothetical protein